MCQGSRIRRPRGGRPAALRIARFVGIAAQHSTPATDAQQETLIVLTRGDRLARALGLHRLLRSNVLPIALGIPWGLFTPYLPQLPLPAQVTIEFGEPLRWDYPAGAENDPEIVGRCYREVESALQRGLDVLAKGRIPFLGRPPFRRP